MGRGGVALYGGFSRLWGEGGSPLTMTAVVHPSATPPRRILMTRAQDACARWADALFPLAARLTYFAPFTTQPVALSPEVRERLFAATRDDATAWALTSARALEALQASDAALAAALRQRAFFAVGDGTAQALRDAGCPHVIAAEGDIASLASQLALHAGTQGIARVIHLAGAVTVADLADVMKQSPLEIETYVVYDAQLNALPAELAADLASGAISDVILLSGRVTQHLGAAIQAQAGEAMPAVAGPARLYCLSSRIADIARASFAPATPEIITAPRPDVVALLTMIDAPAAGLQNIKNELP